MFEGPIIIEASPTLRGLSIGAASTLTQFTGNAVIPWHCLDGVVRLDPGFSMVVSMFGHHGRRVTNKGRRVTLRIKGGRRWRLAVRACRRAMRRAWRDNSISVRRVFDDERRKQRWALPIMALTLSAFTFVGVRMGLSIAHAALEPHNYEPPIFGAVALAAGLALAAIIVALSSIYVVTVSQFLDAGRLRSLRVSPDSICGKTANGRTSHHRWADLTGVREGLPGTVLFFGQQGTLQLFGQETRIYPWVIALLEGLRPDL